MNSSDMQCWNCGTKFMHTVTHIKTKKALDLCVGCHVPSQQDMQGGTLDWLRAAEKPTMEEIEKLLSAKLAQKLAPKVTWRMKLLQWTKK